jgi:hypothetical protein
MKWTQAAMREVAEEERAGLGLGPDDPFDPYALCAEHGIPVYSIGDLSGVSQEAVEHFTRTKTGSWSAALVPVGTARMIIENPAHHPHRRRANISHELGHHLLEHPFTGVLLSESHAEAFAANHEKQATFMAGELLIPKSAANGAAFAGWTNEQVSAHFGVSKQFAQMQMSGPRVYAQRARARYGERVRSRY